MLAPVTGLPLTNPGTCPPSQGGTGLHWHSLQKFCRKLYLTQIRTRQARGKASKLKLNDTLKAVFFIQQ